MILLLYKISILKWIFTTLNCAVIVCSCSSYRKKFWKFPPTKWRTETSTRFLDFFSSVIHEWSSFISCLLFSSWPPLFLYHSLCLLSVMDDSDDPELWQVLLVPVPYLIKRVKCNIEMNSWAYWERKAMATSSNSTVPVVRKREREKEISSFYSFI